MPTRHSTLLFAFAAWPFALLTAHAETATDAWKDIRPMLEQKCYDCHDGKRTKGGV